MGEPQYAVEPNDLEAEESVLGACLLGAGAIARAAALLSPADFYRPTHAAIFRVTLEMSSRGVPVEGVTLAAELERQGLLESVGGRSRVHELVALVPAAGNVDYYARIVREASVNRHVLAAGEALRQAALNGGIAAHPDVVEIVSRALAEPLSGARPLTGMTHADVMAEETEPRPAFLIDDLIEPGVVVTIAGIPETHKSWLATAIAVGVASGSGTILGRGVLDQGPVGYVWQDDSTRNEIERVQLFARVHETSSELPLRWFLNEGVTLPDDIPRLRASIENDHLVLVVLDSFYNVAGGVELKDTEAGRIFANLKANLCDPTGCTVIVVDHMPWATETNRQRLRGYGDVFKGAAVRAGIYVDAIGSSLFIEARGNNIKGFKRTPAFWDAERLELRLLEIEHTNLDEIAERVLEMISRDGVWTSTRSVEKAITGRAVAVRQALENLLEEGLLVSRSAPELARRGRGTYWNLAANDIYLGDLLAGELDPGDLLTGEPEVLAEEVLAEEDPEP